MFKSRKERKELLEGLVISNMDAKIPVFQQVYKCKIYIMSSPLKEIFFKKNSLFFFGNKGSY